MGRSVAAGAADDERTGDDRLGEWLDAEQRLLDHVLALAPLDDLLTELCGDVETFFPGSACSVMRLEGDHLALMAAPSLPGEIAREIGSIPLSVGSCGVAATSRTTVAVADTLTDPRWEALRDLADRAGIRSCWSSPILARHERVLGTISIGGSEPGEPSDDDRRILESAARVAGLAFTVHSIEQAVEHGDRTYRAIFDAANDAIFVHALDTGRILDVNRCMCEMYGYSHREALELGVGQLSAGEPFTDERAAGLITQAASGVPLLFEWHCRRKDGSTFWAEVNLKRIALAGAERILAVVRDISIRKHAEVELRASEKRYRRLVEDLPDLLCRLDASAAITFANEYCARYFGRTTEDLVGRPFLELVPADRHAAVRAQLAALGPQRPSDTHEIPVVTAGGDVRWLRWRSRALIDDSGAITGFEAIGQDITEQRNAAHAIAKSESRLRSIAEASPDVVMLVDTGGRIEFINRVLPHLRRDEVIGSSIYEHVPEEAVRTLRACFERILASGSPDGYDVEYAMPDGEWRTFESRVGPVWHDHRVVAFAINASDVTERRLAERRVRESKREFEQLARSSPSVVFRTDGQGKAVFASDRWQQVTGRAAGSWAGDGWNRAIHSDDRDAVLAAWADAVRRSVPLSHEFRFRHADGRDVWTLGLAVPLRDEGGRVDRFIGTFTDVTRLKEAEVRIRESEARFRELTESINEVFWLTDWKTRRLMYVSPSFETIYDRPCQSLYADASSWLEAVHADDREAVSRAFYEGAEQGEYDVEFRIVRRDGEVLWVHEKAFPIRDHTGTVYRIAGVCEDITERKRVEDALRRKSQTEHLLLRELDHRVRNNLSALVTLVDLTRRAAADVDEFGEAIGRRVNAMAAAHALLSRSRWTMLEFRQIVETLLPPQCAGQLVYTGPRIDVAAERVSSLAMVMHELITNSMKHGSLNHAGGCVEISWSLDETPGADRCVAIRWRERGGPEITAQPNSRVGTSLIEGLVRTDLHGEATLRYPPEGADHSLVVMIGSGPS